MSKTNTLKTVDVSTIERLYRSNDKVGAANLNNWFALLGTATNVYPSDIDLVFDCEKYDRTLFIEVKQHNELLGNHQGQVRLLTRQAKRGNDCLIMYSDYGTKVLTEFFVQPVTEHGLGQRYKIRVQDMRDFLTAYYWEEDLDVGEWLAVKSAEHLGKDFLRIGPLNCPDVYAVKRDDEWQVVDNDEFYSFRAANQAD